MPINEKVITNEIALMLKPVRNVAMLKNNAERVMIIFRPYTSDNTPPGNCMIPYIVHIPVNAHPACTSVIPRSVVIFTSKVDGVMRPTKIRSQASEISSKEDF